MGAYAAITTAVYLVNKNPVFHEVMYGILVFTLLAMDLRLTQVQESKAGKRLFYSGFLM